MDDEYLLIAENLKKKQNIWVSGVNTILGRTIIEVLRNDHEVDTSQKNSSYEFFGSLNDEFLSSAHNISKVVPLNDIEEFDKTISKITIFILDLSLAYRDENSIILNYVENSENDLNPLPIIVIGISNVMTWSACPKNKEDKKKDTKIPGLDNLLGSPTYQDKPWTCYDYKQRIALPKYSHMRIMEEKILNLNTRKDLIGFVVCSGFQYGFGENVLYQMFKECYSNSSPCLKIFGDGKNIIPLIHFKDIALFVLLTLHFQPKHKYIVAIDHAKYISQGALMEAIALSYGPGNAELKTVEESIFQKNYELFVTDLQFSSIDIEFFIGVDENKIEKLEDMRKKENFDDWHCKTGLIANISKITEEFRAYRGLQALRLMVVGPPSIGKSHYSDLLSKHYNIPSLRVEKVMAEFFESSDPRAGELKFFLQSTKETKLKEAQDALDKARKKNRNLPLEVDPSTINVRLNSDDLSYIFVWRISKPDAYNRGFILDGYPKQVDHAKVFFKDLKEKLKINIQLIVKLYAKDEFIIENIKKLSPEPGSHHTESHFARRNEIWKANWLTPTNSGIQNSGLEPTNMPDLINSLKIRTYEANIMDNGPGVFDEIKNFAQNELGISSLRRRSKIEEEFHLELLEEEKSKRETEMQKIIEEEENKKMMKEAFEIQEKMEAERKKAEEAEKEQLSKRNLPVMQYLQEHILPVLTEGIIQIYHTKTNDPTEFMIQFLNDKVNENMKKKNDERLGVEERDDEDDSDD